MHPGKYFSIERALNGGFASAQPQVSIYGPYDSPLDAAREGATRSARGLIVSFEELGALIVAGLQMTHPSEAAAS